MEWSVVLDELYNDKLGSREVFGGEEGFFLVKLDQTYEDSS